MAKTNKSSLPIDGVLLVDKPTGQTSNKVLQQVKRLYNARKAGHTGSLDPLASGMLPICFGKATKFAQYLLDSDKHYIAEATLGVMTDTGDTEGQIIQQRPVGKISDSAIALVLEKFKGEQEQVPPMHSALKHKGQPLYKLARKGIEVERKSRKVTIHQLTLLERTDTTLVLDVVCSKGTYIRTLVEDIGKALLCGATISMLRRVNVASFSQQTMYTLPQLQNILEEEGQEGLEKRMLPMTHAIACLPSITVNGTEWQYLAQGRTFKPLQAMDPGFVQLHLATGKPLGVGQIDGSGKLSATRLLFL